MDVSNTKVKASLLNWVAMRLLSYLVLPRRHIVVEEIFTEFELSIFIYASYLSICLSLSLSSVYLNYFFMLVCLSTCLCVFEEVPFCTQLRTFSFSLLENIAEVVCLTFVSKWFFKKPFLFLLFFHEIVS